MKKFTTIVFFGLTISACLVGRDLQAQVDLKFATYGTDSPMAGAAPITGTASTLGPVTVTEIYTNTTATYTYNFLSDASGVSNYIYYPISATAPDPLVAGNTYTGLTVTAAPFSPNLELTLPAGTVAPTATPTNVTGLYSAVAESAVTTTSVLTDNYTVPTSTTPNDIEPVQFTFTPSAAATVTPVTGNYTGTDANGDKINFYRPTGGLTFATGNTYTIDGYAFSFSTGTEIYDPAIVATVAVPEPSSWFLMVSGLLGLGFFARRNPASKEF